MLFLLFSLLYQLLNDLHDFIAVALFLPLAVAIAVVEVVLGNAVEVGNLLPNIICHAIVQAGDVGHLCCPFIDRTGFVGYVDEHHITIFQFLFQRFRRRNAYSARSAPGSPEVDEDGLAWMLSHDVLDEFVASDVGGGHHAFLCFSLNIFYEQSDAVVILTEWRLKLGMGSLDGAV